ncbi:hypothetical protein KIN20_016741 [Parelaphostrongylus tenuis]|uniref:Uncharacterized protein n=1 Tax=Parelaphostrongylus tenuis TaxID=148309 RepID=A0AAD5QN48_PARTN|nr:hypothetical protein KIN20_016741 [Parelaphostrongylus tenuis]
MIWSANFESLDCNTDFAERPSSSSLLLLECDELDEDELDEDEVDDELDDDDAKVINLIRISSRFQTIIVALRFFLSS